MIIEGLMVRVWPSRCRVVLYIWWYQITIAEHFLALDLDLIAIPLNRQWLQWYKSSVCAGGGSIIAVERLVHAIDIFQTKYKHDNRKEVFPF